MANRCEKYMHLYKCPDHSETDGAACETCSANPDSPASIIEAIKKIEEFCHNREHCSACPMCETIKNRKGIVVAYNCGLREVIPSKWSEEFAFMDGMNPYVTNK